MAALPQVKGDPYTWPFDGKWTPENTVLIIIDMQVRLTNSVILPCGARGYGTRENECCSTAAHDVAFHCR